MANPGIASGCLRRCTGRIVLNGQARMAAEQRAGYAPKRYCNEPQQTKLRHTVRLLTFPTFETVST
jgi:hypothetical protein